MQARSHRANIALTEVVQMLDLIDTTRSNNVETLLKCMRKWPRYSNPESSRKQPQTSPRLVTLALLARESAHAHQERHEVAEVRHDGQVGCSKAGSAYEISDKQLNSFIAKFEKEESGRHPPIESRRGLLLEARHRCGVCKQPYSRRSRTALHRDGEEAAEERGRRHERVDRNVVKSRRQGERVHRFDDRPLPPVLNYFAVLSSSVRRRPTALPIGLSF